MGKHVFLRPILIFTLIIVLQITILETSSSSKNNNNNEHHRVKREEEAAGNSESAKPESRKVHVIKKKPKVGGGDEVVPAPEEPTTEKPKSKKSTAQPPSAEAAEGGSTEAPSEGGESVEANADPDWLVDISIDPFAGNNKWLQFVGRVKLITASLDSLVNEELTVKNKENIQQNFSSIWSKFNEFFQPFHEELFESASFLEINPAIGLTNLNELEKFIRTKPTGQRDQTRIKWVEVISLATHGHYVFDRLSNVFHEYGFDEIKDVLSIEYPSWDTTKMQEEPSEADPFALMKPADLIQKIDEEILSLGDKNHLVRGLERILRKNMKAWNPRKTDLNKYCYGQNKFATIHDEIDLLIDAAFYLVIADLKFSVVQITDELHQAISDSSNEDGYSAKVKESLTAAGARIDKKIKLSSEEPPAELITVGPLIMNCDLPPAPLEECIRDPEDPEVFIKNGVVHLKGQGEAKLDEQQFPLYSNGSRIPGIEPVKRFIAEDGSILSSSGYEVDKEGKVVNKSTNATEENVKVKIDYEPYIYVPILHEDEMKLIAPKDGQWGKFDCEEEKEEKTPDPYSPDLPFSTPRLEPQSGPHQSYEDNRGPSPDQVAPEKLISFTNALSAYLEPEVVLNPKGSCVGTCQDYKNPTEICKNTGDHCDILRDSVCADGGTGCLQKSKCPSKARRCQRTSQHVSFCPAKNHSRLYDWLSINNKIRSVLDLSNTTEGQQPSCDEDVVKINEAWAMENNLVLTAPQYCEICLCVCDEPLSEDGFHYIDLGNAEADLKDGFVVTGFKFVQEENVLRLNVEQGKLLPNGDIDPATVDWVKSTAIPDKTDEAKAIRLGSAGFKRMNLDLVLAKTNQLITGIRFVKSESNGTAGGASISLEAQMTTFETKEGEISLKAEDSTWSKPSYPTPVEPRHLINLGEVTSPITQRGPSQPFDLPDNSKAIEFDVTSLKIDGGQAVVPFFDPQPVHSPTVQRMPLQGVGLLYKSKRGSGGYVAPTAVLYEKAS